ncbi:MAG: hypothetical protein F4124_02700 [Acidimicrobiia bacterium]|nr:OB-fold domain-containing protein [bacterium]MXW57417.1 hypothetical protein [Acidimicrobiia bacterium]MXZ76958.1 hypothetical protein [Acidimicrobiia bacterium]MXZ86169.1 hypothetical protein [Acidimicrobiia bacterium]MYB72489.1 hypothetical protein [Acidimicrobiia bacterium]
MPTLSTTPPERAGADPRPELAVREGRILLNGSRCGNCGYPLAVNPPRCPICGSDSMAPATFGPKGTVFSSTVLRVPVPGRTPPFTLAYVDVDDGPRILAHVDGPDEPLVPGSRVALAGWSEHGDPVVQRTGP